MSGIRYTDVSADGLMLHRLKCSRSSELIFRTMYDLAVGA